MDVAPAPALTSDQRLHLELFGYVVVEEVLTAAETERLRERILELEADYRADGPVKRSARREVPAWALWQPNPSDDGSEPPGHFYLGTTPELFRIDNLPHVDPAFLDYVTHPRIVAMAEEAIGGTVRLEQSDAHISRPPIEHGLPADFGYHRGAFSGMAYTLEGLYHFPFVKCTNLTDLGPDDGGTTVIAGTHKLDDALVPAAIAGAQEAAAAGRPSPVRTVAAPAGSTLVFFESLVHSAGVNRSGKERVLIVAGYTPPMYSPWAGYDPAPSLVAGLAQEHVDVIAAPKRWLWHPRPRSALHPQRDRPD